ncbi:MAG: hypothetical protein RLZZ262_621 [Bacteroidota bacterium]|jgi:uncharacterized protein (TIGR02757 family)
MMRNRISRSDLQEFMDEQVERFNHPSFIEHDPISIPHRFDLKEDIEIAGFFAATLAWGNRKSIIKSGTTIMDLMDDAPYDYVLHAQKRDLKKLSGFVHRTFNGEDLTQFVLSLRHIYSACGGMETLFAKGFDVNAAQGIAIFRNAFFEIAHTSRTTKHVSDPTSGSAAKRLHMFLRWMVRRDKRGVDFGIWKSISPSALSIPLDVHSGNIARQLSLLKRKQNDAKAVEELDAELRKLDPNDPVKYDFALFGLGVSGDWKKFGGQ